MQAIEPEKNIDHQRYIGASRAFYEKLGFRVLMGDQAKNWLILQNDTSTIGLLQRMFTRNTLTFNAGWDRKAATLPEFDDVRAIQRTLKSRGLTLAGGERVDIRTGKLDGHRPRWESNPDRPTRTQPQEVIALAWCDS